MKFRVKDLNNCLSSKKINWQKMAESLTLKTFEAGFDGRTLDLDILPNLYPSHSSLNGLAKEISLLSNVKTKFLNKKIGEGKKKISDVVSVKIETKKCSNYYGRVILGLKNKKSPAWLKTFVEFYDFNSINFLVDLSNFVMIEFGAPLHIFDLDKIEPIEAIELKKSKKTIIVREAKEAEDFYGINKNHYLLPDGSIVIADSKKIIALAGIQGAKSVEVDLATKNILIEAAVFASGQIYQTSRRIGLKTEASYRFERKVAAINSFKALERIAGLIEAELGGEVLRGRVEFGRIEAKKVFLNFEKLNQVFGGRIEKKVVEEILKKAGLILIKKTDKFLYLKVPAERLDLNIEEDLIEEVIRLFGLEKIKSKLPLDQEFSQPEERLNLINAIKQEAISAGFDETVNYSFSQEKEFELFEELINKLDYNLEAAPVKILNPISNAYEIYRPSLLPGLIRAAKANQRLVGFSRFFEIGDCGLKLAKGYKERSHFGALICLDSVQDSLLEAKGFIGYLFERLGLTGVNWRDQHFNLFEAGALIEDSKKETIGLIGLLSKKIEGFYDLNKRAVAVEIDLERLNLELKDENEFEPLSQFPAINRDLSFVISETISLDFIEKSIQDLGGDLLEDVELVDVYQGRGIKDDEKAITLRLIFRSKERSLKDEEVNRLLQIIIKDLVNSFKAAIR